MPEIILIRHGQTALNAERVFRGQFDVPLDDHGHRQARLVAEALAARGLHAIHSSPLARARETAEAIAACCDLSIEEAPPLIDMDFGHWQGRPMAEVERRWPALLHAYYTAPETFRAPGGESLEDVRRRAMAFLAAAAETGSEQPIALVSHRVVIKVILGDILGGGLRPFWRLRQDTAAISELREYGGRLALATVNERCHLAPLGAGDSADF